MKILTLLLVVPIFVTTPSLAAEERQARVSFWVEPAATKVFKDSPAGLKREIEIFAARGEWESAQVVLRGEGEVSLEMTEMTGLEGSQVLPAGWAEVRRVVYVPVPYVPKDFPDPLRPIQGALSLPKGENLPILVTMRVPRDAKPGDYLGQLKVRPVPPGGDALASVPVKLHVWPFEVPEKPSVKTAFGISLDFALHHEGIERGTPEARKMHERYYEALVSHRISPYEIPVDVLDPDAGRFVDDPRVTSFQLPYREDVAWMRARVDRAREKGWLSKAYFYPWDEPITEEQYRALKDCAARIRSVDPKLRIVSPFYCDPKFGGTAYDALEGVVNIWCSVSAYFKPDRMEEKRRAGGEVWWYVCCGPGAPYANLHLTMDGMDHRILPWQMYKYRIEGFLYWSTTYWNPAHMKSPWTDMVTVPDINKNLSGDGSLLYPGKLPDGTRVSDGPVASLRLLLLRDGFEDLEYLCLLEKKLGRGAAEEAAGRLVRDLTKFSKDPQELEGARREIGAKLSAAPPVAPPASAAEEKGGS